VNVTSNTTEHVNFLHFKIPFGKKKYSSQFNQRPRILLSLVTARSKQRPTTRDDLAVRRAADAAAAIMTSPASTSSWFSGLTRASSSSMAGGVSSAPASASVPDAPAAAAKAVVAAAGGRRKQLQGTLFKYGPKSAQVAFKTGDFNHQVIFIGGLTDGLLATDYLEPLSLALEVEKWSLVQPLLSSSYTGYGISSLEQDALELDQLISYLINKENSEGVILLGHSTGCQDIVHYMKTNFACSKAVSGVILQAPVSDREYRATLPETAEMIDLAAKMISEGRGMDLMPREANPDAPITAYRFHSLCSYMGDDDMFSSDLSEDQLRQRLGHMSTTQCQQQQQQQSLFVPSKFG
ncbi:hypothetical protein EJB05_13459, partial [Eragrostis curvula]